MLRVLSTAPIAALAALVLVACTAPAPAPTAAPPPQSGNSTPHAGWSLPSCGEIETAVAALVDGLTYDEAISTEQTAPETYDQRVCVFVAADTSTQLGVTVAAIPFLESELELYATMPGVIADDRTADGSAVLQSLDPNDAVDGHLDSALYLFDLANSITIQGYSKSGSTVATLPALTVPAATEAAFAVRGLL